MKTKMTGKIVLEYLKRFPKTPSVSLARKIYKENREVFTNVETVRTRLRYYRGISGIKNFKKLEKKDFVIKRNSLNPYNLPRTYAQKAKVVNLPIECNNVLLISDLHIPFHDIKALSVALKYGKEQNVNCIFINGDLLDFFMISKFVRFKPWISVQEELELTREFLGVLNEEFPDVPIYFLIGNHDQRLETYLATKAPELLDVPEFKLEDLLKGFNMRVLDDDVLVKMGKLSVTHGHKLLRGFFSPVNPARGTFLRAKASTIIGHLHKVSTHTETTITGKTIACYSMGCLCELNPRYAPLANNFTHGFTHVRFEKSGNFTVKNIQILDGQIVN